MNVEKLFIFCIILFLFYMWKNWKWINVSMHADANYMRWEGAKQG